MPLSSISSVQFRRIVWAHYRAHGRHTLPWRKTKNVYRILVSEVMLQQTQVERVLPYYRAFLKRFPTPSALAEAPLAEVLAAWQGLGYNRRAKLLHEAAKKIAAEGAPRSVPELEALPGVGPYTARAVAAFAWNEGDIVIETNIRTAVLHHFFADKNGVADTEIAAVLARTLPKGRARDWYAALMDYGASLKRSGVRVNAKSAGYLKQSAFEGSARQTRGAIVRALAAGPAPKARLLKLFSPERTVQLETQLEKLVKEGMVERRGRFYRLPA